VLNYSLVSSLVVHDVVAGLSVFFIVGPLQNSIVGINVERMDSWKING